MKITAGLPEEGLSGVWDRWDCPLLYLSSGCGLSTCTVRLSGLQQFLEEKKALTCKAPHKLQSGTRLNAPSFQ